MRTLDPEDFKTVYELKRTFRGMIRALKNLHSQSLFHSNVRLESFYETSGEFERKGVSRSFRSTSSFRTSSELRPPPEEKQIEILHARTTRRISRASDEWDDFYDLTMLSDLFQTPRNWPFELYQLFVEEGADPPILALRIIADEKGNRKEFDDFLKSRSLK